MRSLAVTDHPSLFTTALPFFPEHCIFTGSVSGLELPEHQSNFGLVCLLSGSLDFTLNGFRKPLDNSRFLIINKNSRFSMRVQKNKAEPFMLYFQSRTPALITGQDNPDWSATERVYPVTASFQKRIHQLAALPGSCSSFVTMQGDAIIRAILGDILSFNHHSHQESLQLEVRKPATRHENYKRLIAARDWIEDNFNAALTLEELSGVAAMNHQHFLRLFAQLFHKTPRQYIIDRRIDEAKQLLKKTETPIAEICTLVGWDSAGTFSQLFKQKTGQTPGAFRKDFRR